MAQQKLILHNCSAGLHTVAMVPTANCPGDWSAPGVAVLSPMESPKGGSYTYTFNESGTYYFACSWSDHCVSGETISVLGLAGQACKEAQGCGTYLPHACVGLCTSA